MITETNATEVEVWVKRQGQSPIRIWNQNDIPLPYGASDPYGHNALICSIYHNEWSSSLPLYHRYDQIIFSKNFIPWPQV
jgi:hypothetical protein